MNKNKAHLLCERPAALPQRSRPNRISRFALSKHKITVLCKEETHTRESKKTNQERKI